MGIGKVSSLAAASLSKVSSLAKLSIGKISSVTASFAAVFADDKSLTFDGVNDYVDISDFTFTNQNITISWWAKRQQYIGNGEVMIAAFDDITSDQWYSSFLVQYWGPDGVRIGVGNNSGSYLFENCGNIGFTHDVWHHFVYTCGAGAETAYVNPANMALYMDNDLVWEPTFNEEEGTTVGTASPAYKLYIAAAPSGTSTFTGNINDVSVHSAVLDSRNIGAIYNSGAAIDLTSNSGDYNAASDLAGYWLMGDGDTYPTIEDQTSNGNDGTMTNMTSGDIVTDAPS